MILWKTPLTRTIFLLRESRECMFLNFNNSICIEIITHKRNGVKQGKWMDSANYRM